MKENMGLGRLVRKLLFQLNQAHLNQETAKGVKIPGEM